MSHQQILHEKHALMLSDILMGQKAENNIQHLVVISMLGSAPHIFHLHLKTKMPLNKSKSSPSPIAIATIKRYCTSFTGRRWQSRK